MPLITTTPLKIAVSILFSEEDKIVASDAADDDLFGTDVSLTQDGNLAMVGARHVGAPNRGKVYSYTRSGVTWSTGQAWQGSNSSHLEFGRSVSVSSDGTTIAVGVLGVSGVEQGAVYIYRKPSTTWIEQDILTASDAQNNDEFGNAVALSSDGNSLLVGAWKEDGSGTNRGAVYFFTRSGSPGTWTQQQKIVASDPTNSAQFGASVAITPDGNTAVVGANNINAGRGAVYVFNRSGSPSTWTEQQKMTASDGTFGDVMGRTVAISADGSTVLAGAHLVNGGGGPDQGAAYIFRKTAGSPEWGTTETQKLSATDAFGNDNFGIDVALNTDGVTAIIGAYHENSNTGAVYLFTESTGTWTESQKMTASDAATGDNFGFSVDITPDGNTLLIGAEQEAGAGSDRGAAYIFVR